MRRFLTCFALFVTIVCLAYPQRSDLAGIKICIDPGHGGYDSNDRRIEPDAGNVFWESESNFQKALLLKSLLEAKGATVILTRTSNTVEPSLSARWQLANANNVDWFHSIHSNATSLPLGQNTQTNYTLMLVKEEISTRQAAWPEAIVMSDIIGPAIQKKLRTSPRSKYTYLDYTFYGGPPNGFNLGVLSGLAMPGELSEGSMHDYYPETRRLMNNSYRKMEAYAIRDAFLSYFGVPADSSAIVAGLISEVGTGRFVDAAVVRLLPENIIYTGDRYRNGFFMFDAITPGVHTIRFETPGYRTDSVQITLTPRETRFVDKGIESLAAPVVLSSTPGRNDTVLSAAAPIQFTFSKAMDTASVRSAFSITPAVRGDLIWSVAFTKVTFKPDSVVLPFNTSFVLRIEGTARSQTGSFLDGNGDGTPADAFQVAFRTQPVDIWPPTLVSAFAANGSMNVPSNTVINFTYDEPLDPSSVNMSNIVIQEGSGAVPSRTLQYNLANGRGGFNIYPYGGLHPGESYRIRISGVRDLTGNAIPASNPLWTFTVAPTASQFTMIEDFASSVSSWWQPVTSGSTIGVDSATFTHDSLVTLALFTPPASSGRLSYRWNTSTATDWLIREYLASGPGRSVTWAKIGRRLQAYLFGDGSGMQFRFAIDDSVEAFPGGTTSNHEVSPWILIDWVGWRLVEWDMAKDSVGSWLGNGKLEGMLRFDSFQLRYTPNSRAASGKVHFAQLQVAKSTPVFAEYSDQFVPGPFELLQNYPNPFNPTTAISYQLPALSARQTASGLGVDGSAVSVVTLKVYDVLGREVATLVNNVQAPGSHVVRWNGKSDSGEQVSSGIYLYQLRAGSLVMTRKMLLIR